MVTFGDASDSDGSIGITGICLRKQDDKLVFDTGAARLMRNGEHSNPPMHRRKTHQFVGQNRYPLSPVSSGAGADRIANRTETHWQRALPAKFQFIAFQRRAGRMRLESASGFLVSTLFQPN